MIALEHPSSEEAGDAKEIVRAEFDRTMSALNATFKEIERIDTESAELQIAIAEKMQMLKNLHWQDPEVRSDLIEEAAQEIELLTDRAHDLERKQTEQKILNDAFFAASEELLRYLHSFDRGGQPQA
ncbi:MAG: hypothetical protein Q8P82_00855 [bacterium]|nr:hypothetical protein [bacterium]